MTERLTSTSNPRVRWVKALHQAKNRRAEGVALAEGIKAVAEFARSPERVAAHGSYEPVFGTNPLAIAIPAVALVVLGLFPALLLEPVTSALLSLIP